MAHHLAHYLWHDEPGDLDIFHAEVCRGRRHCCKPDHLRAGTHEENMAGMHRQSRGHRRLTAEDVPTIRFLG
jgi:hypothetical protein